MKNGSLSAGSVYHKNALTHLACEASRGQSEKGLITDYVTQKVGELLHSPDDSLEHDVHLMLYGMDSLLFFRLLENIGTELKVTIPPSQALASFQNLTINNLSALVEQTLKEHAADIPSESPQIVQAPLVPDDAKRHEPFPLTDIQYAYWIGQSGAVGWGNVPCNAYAEFDRTDEEFDFARFNLALQQVIQRHDMLRAVVLPNGKQQILKEVPAYEVKILDLRKTPAHEVERSLAATRQEMTAAKAQSDTWPLFEFRATRYDGNRIRFHINLDLLIFDGQSIQILFRDLARFYDVNDQAPAPLSLSFRDYVRSLRSLDKTALYERSKRYWLDKLDSMPQPPELPMAKDMTSLSAFRFQGREFALSPTAWKQFKQFAAHNGITPSSALLTAYTKVLALWNRHDSFTLNLTQYNRLPLHPEVTEILGDFTSIILLAVHDIPGEHFAGSAQRIQEDLLQGMEHRYFNGIDVMREITVRQEGNRPYIVPYVFTSITGVGSSLDDATQEKEEKYLVGESSFMSVRTPQVVLDHQIREKKNALSCRWDVVEELFPKGMIDDMFAMYKSLLERLCTDETAWHTPVPMVLPEYQRLKRLEINASAGEQSAELLHTLFARTARKQPHSTAIITSDTSMTYGELDRRARLLAHDLRAAGAECGSMVAVVMHKGWEQVVAVLGILYAGAAYLPIDAAFPEQRVHLLLKNAEADLVVTQPAVQSKYRWPSEVSLFRIDSASVETVISLPEFKPLQTEKDLAYVIYTSGSTGLPKGVMIDHRGAVNTILDVNERFNVTPQDRVFALSNLNFDLSVYDIFGTLAAGAAIVIPDSEQRKDPSHWLELMVRENATIWNSVPALMQMLIEYASSHPELTFPSLRLALLSGDWIPLDLPDRIRDRAAEMKIIGMGGATEASIWSILYPIGKVESEWRSIPYGFPMKNQQMHVLNHTLEHCPDWVPGQIFIGGIGLAKGYWKDKEKTDACFIVHPKTKETLYRTGDMGRYTPEGYIEFLGREDSQVKINGYRIELSEVETALLSQPAVRESAVVVGSNAQGQPQLVGYFVAKKGNAPSTEALRNHLAQQLPEYMIPPALILLDNLPLTTNGKVDQKQLVRQAAQYLQANRPKSIAPRNDIEQQVADVWRDILGCKEIGVLDNFFEMGGNSLLALRLHTRLQDISPRELSVVNIFEYPTVSDLSHFMAAEHLDSGAPNQTIDRGNRRRERLKQKMRGRKRKA
jgi:amino acid adenylation domain-containing protein